MSEAESSIPWDQPLDRDWWTDTGARLGGSEQQIAFACCVFSGTMTQKQAAILAGYGAETDRKAIHAGSTAAKSRVVQNLLVMARAEVQRRELPATSVEPFSQEEWTQRLQEIARGPDAKLAMQAAQILFEGKPRSTEPGHFALLDDGFNGWRVCRDFLRVPGGAVAIASIHAAEGAELCGIPLLHDVVILLRRDDPEFYDRLRSRQSKIGLATLDQHLADPNWQRAARVKLWREVGVEIDETTADAKEVA
ncbi:hypothetical protein I6F36_06460 [Bradyrhizobium sp. BRP19]|uniref:hypothetical protein n=1 Tax=Bradyrhizobium sp. BRP19 TaxID=2793823 RepID=UPI001CD30D0B|nr:hypothetical protein [Bradyrhizobium sp. BRP19]MCA1546447.1 hypothetical protein [Bradyrhizobium sp. BRP19]